MLFVLALASESFIIKKPENPVFLCLEKNTIYGTLQTQQKYKITGYRPNT